MNDDVIDLGFTSLPADLQQEALAAATSRRTVLLTGSRSFRDAKLLWDVLDGLCEEFAEDGVTEMVLRHGAAYPSIHSGGGSDKLRSADYLAHMWVPWSHKITVVEDAQPASWNRCGPGCPPNYTHRRRRKGGITYCPEAGPRRNNTMVALGADLCVAFFLNGGGAGTRHCVQAATTAGIPVRTYGT